MICFCILFLFSFLLESLSSNLIKDFIPFFPLVVIVVMSVLKLDNKKIIPFLFGLGVLYDLFYTNFIFIHGFIYVLLFYLASFILKENKNFFIMFFSYYIMIFTYSLIMLFYSLIISNVNVLLLVKCIAKSLVINSVYFIMVYIIFIGIKCLIKNIKNKRTY